MDELRNELSLAVEKVLETSIAFEEASKNCEKLCHDYFSRKYFGERNPDCVFTTDGKRREVVVDRFIIVNDDIDCKPKIEGRIRLPFGTLDKVINLFPSQWTTPIMEDAYGNR